MATQFDRAIRYLALRLTGEMSLAEVEDELHRALDELLGAAARAVDQLYNAAYQGEIQHHRQGNKLQKEVDKWLT